MRTTFVPLRCAWQTVRFTVCMSSTTEVTKLRKARIAAGYSLEQLGRVIDKSGETVRLYELGRSRPHPQTAKRLEDALSIPRNVLFAPDTEKADPR
jgi:transcriptional regulator with XRE-family HTH domain